MFFFKDLMSYCGLLIRFFVYFQEDENDFMTSKITLKMPSRENTIGENRFLLHIQESRMIPN